MQKTDRALEMLNAALRHSPKNTLCKFERASILFSIERYHDALQGRIKSQTRRKQWPLQLCLGRKGC